jgi:hypothetical protein
MKEKAKPSKNPLKSVNSQALQFIQLAEEMQQVEDEIKMSFMRRGKTNLWMDFLRERNRIVAENKSEEIAMEKAKAKRKQEISEAIEMLLAIVAGVLLITLLAWGTMEYADFMRK